MCIDTIQNPMWDNLRELLRLLEEQNIKYNQYRITHNGNRMEVLILSILPRWFIVDSEGIYIDSKNIM